MRCETMTEDVVGAIEFILGLLRKTLVEHGVSMGVSKVDGDILFFSTDEYLRDKENYKTFSVKLEELVK